VIRRPRQVALVRCTGGCVSRATDISGHSVHLTAQATRRLLATRSAVLGATGGAVAARGAGFSGCTPHCVALVRCTCECVSRATDISGRSLDLTAQATRRLRLSDPLPSGRRVAPWRPGGAGFSGRTPQTHGRPNGSGLETLAERNKFATKAVRIRGRSRPTLQHAGVMRNHAEHGIGHWGVEPRALLLSFRALTSPAQSSATFKSRARGSSNPVKSVVR
jgi:hypothetical protein